MFMGVSVARRELPTDDVVQVDVLGRGGGRNAFGDLAPRRDARQIHA
jgi:hypothetical protein